jgi:plastocyanin
VSGRDFPHVTASIIGLLFVLATVESLGTAHGINVIGANCKDDSSPPNVSFLMQRTVVSLANASQSVVLDIRGLTYDNNDGKGCGVQSVKVKVENYGTGQILQWYQIAHPMGDNSSKWSTWIFNYQVQSEGQYRIVAKATDSNGNTKWNSIVIKVVSGKEDKDTPKITIESPANGAIFLRKSVPEITFNVDGSALDLSSGIESVQVSIKDPHSLTLLRPYENATPAAINDWSSWTYQLTLENEGNYIIVARAVDKAGNMAWSKVMVTNQLDTNISISPGSSIRGNPSFVPRFMIVSVGDIVTWTNNDSFSHIVTSGDPLIAEPDLKFKSGLMGPNATFSFTVASPGEYQYFCAIHPFMTGDLVAE